MARVYRVSSSKHVSLMQLALMQLALVCADIVLFAPAFPLAAAICLLSNIWRIRADACLLLYNMQRPQFRQAQDIGTLQ